MLYEKAKANTFYCVSSDALINNRWQSRSEASKGGIVPCKVFLTPWLISNIKGDSLWHSLYLNPLISVIGDIEV